MAHQLSPIIFNPTQPAYPKDVIYTANVRKSLRDCVVIVISDASACSMVALFWSQLNDMCFVKPRPESFSISYFDFNQRKSIQNLKFSHIQDRKSTPYSRNFLFFALCTVYTASVPQMTLRGSNFDDSENLEAFLDDTSSILLIEAVDGQYIFMYLMH